MGLKTLTGLWENEKGHLSVKANEEIRIPAGTRVFVFKNQNRQRDAHPTHNLVIAVDDDEAPQQQRQQQPQQQGYGSHPDF